MSQIDAKKYIWQCDGWPNWRYDLNQLQARLASVEEQQHKLFSGIAQIGEQQQQLMTLDAVTNEVRQSSAIEGVRLDAQSVRASVARRLGVDIGGLDRFDRYVEGVVDMVMDATMRCNEPLTAERLYGWHAVLFPSGYSGFYPVAIGRWRDDKLGAMQVVSGAVGHQTVHYEAPPASRLGEEMSCFLQWINEPSDEHPILRAAIAHLWFVTIHPFDDGNGRVGRAIGDMMLARADGQSQRYYSFSAQAMRDREGYYKALECTQQDNMDVTAWAQWFVGALQKSLSYAQVRLDATLQRARYWQSWEHVPMNERQKKVLARLLEDFQGYMKVHKWQNIAKCSEQQAVEDISQLVDAGILQAVPGSGKKTSYELVMNPSPDENIVEAAEAVQTEQQAMLDGASVAQAYEVTLANYVEAKHNQVARLEDRLENLIEQQEARVQQMRENAPGMLSLPGKKRAWQANTAREQARLQTLRNRLEAVREIRDGMSLRVPRIEELATRKMRAENPQLASSWDAMREEQRRLEIEEQKRVLKAREEQRQTQVQSQSPTHGRGRVLSLSRRPD